MSFKITVFAIFAISMMFPLGEIHGKSTENPAEQMAQGVSSEDIVCKEKFVLVHTKSGRPACVKPTSVLPLIESGWAAPDTVNKLSISDISSQQVSSGAYAYQFKYCAAIYNKDVVGVLVISDVEKVPVPIDPNISLNDCQQYGTQIHTEERSVISHSPFYTEDIPNIIKDFEQKKMNLEDERVKQEQKLLKLQDPNLNGKNQEEIENVQNKIEWYNQVIESCKDGLKTIRSL